MKSGEFPATRSARNWLLRVAGTVAVSLIVQRICFVAYQQTTLLYDNPAAFNPIQALLGGMSTFWDQRLSWQGRGEAGFAMLTVLGPLAPLLRGPWYHKVIPLGLLSIYVAFLFYWEATVNYVGTREYWTDIGWRMFAAAAVIGAALAADRALRRVFLKEVEHEGSTKMRLDTH